MSETFNSLRDFFKKVFDIQEGYERNFTWRDHRLKKWRIIGEKMLVTDDCTHSQKILFSTRTEDTVYVYCHGFVYELTSADEIKGETSKKDLLEKIKELENLIKKLN